MGTETPPTSAGSHSRTPSMHLPSLKRVLSNFKQGSKTNGSLSSEQSSNTESDLVSPPNGIVTSPIDGTITPPNSAPVTTTRTSSNEGGSGTQTPESDAPRGRSSNQLNGKGSSDHKPNGHSSRNPSIALKRVLSGLGRAAHHKSRSLSPVHRSNSSNPISPTAKSANRISFFQHSSSGSGEKVVTPAAAQSQSQSSSSQQGSSGDGTPKRARSVSKRRGTSLDRKIERRVEREAKAKAEAQEKIAYQKRIHEEDPLGDRYGALPLNRSETHSDRKLDSLVSLGTKQPGDNVTFRARVHHLRAKGSKMVFLVLRNQVTTVQGVLTEEPDVVSHNMVRWAEGILTRETIVLVDGIVKLPPPSQPSIKATTIHNIEIKITKLFIVSQPTASLPFTVDDVWHPVDSQSEALRVGDKTRFNNRVLDLRSPANHAIYRIRAGVVHFFRQSLVERGFLEIQSSKFQGGGTESGAEVFKVDYFRRPAFLAQSPQLAKQMCIAADMEKVFEVGPVFRAENSNTHRHLTEFTGLDLEMAFDNHYHEVLDTIDHMFLSVFRGLQSQFRAEIEMVKKRYPHEEFVFLDKTLRLKFSEGIQMLKDSGWKNDDGSDPSEFEDLSTRSEQRLGALVKEKYNTDFYILDKFPASVRPFYTMPDPTDDRLSNSFDIFIRGEEVLSGSQRIHDAVMLESRMAKLGIDPDTMRDYINGFRWGCPPHGGGGVGLERVVMLFLKLGDIRWASLFPRDPKSFPQAITAPVPGGPASVGAAAAVILHGPESATYTPTHPAPDLPPLPNLIAKYGDATNTSWLDPMWVVWRDRNTGAAVGYVPMDGFAVTFGNPLCEPKSIPRVVKSYLAFCDAENLKPVWACIGIDMEKHLAGELGWSAVIAVAEERVDPTATDPGSNDKTVRRKIHKAETDGVKIVDVDGEPDEETKKKILLRCADWSAGRKGTQVHLTGIRPFDDPVHRKYFYAVDKSGEICALVVLAQLAAVHGFQIKWALEFPGAPSGAIEFILTTVIKRLGDAGVRTTTFGAGATGSLQRVENVGGFRVRTLEKVYNGLSTAFHLNNKGDFRSKFGTEQDPLYICYPKGGLGLKGIEAIMHMLQHSKSNQTVTDCPKDPAAITAAAGVGSAA